MPAVGVEESDAKLWVAWAFRGPGAVYESSSQGAGGAEGEIGLAWVLSGVASAGRVDYAAAAVVVVSGSLCVVVHLRARPRSGKVVVAVKEGEASGRARRPGKRAAAYWHGGVAVAVLVVASSVRRKQHVCWLYAGWRVR